MGRARSSSPATDSFTAVFGNTRGVSAHLLPAEPPMAVPRPQPPSELRLSDPQDSFQWIVDVGRFSQRRYRNRRLRVRVHAYSGPENLGEWCPTAAEWLCELDKDTFRARTITLAHNGITSMHLNNEQAHAVSEYLRTLIAYYDHD